MHGSMQVVPALGEEAMWVGLWGAVWGKQGACDEDVHAAQRSHLTPYSRRRMMLGSAMQDGSCQGLRHC